jgi:hypothetical protein
MNRHSTFPVLILAAFIAFSLSSCSPRMVRDDSFRITVEPEPVIRGKVGTVSIDAPMDASEVIGVVRVAGSPQFIFRKDRKRGNWYFMDKMPVSAWNPPGKYTIRIIVKEPPAKPRYAEREIELK